MTELRHKRFYEKRQFERAIAPEVKAERMAREDRSSTLRIALMRLAQASERDPFNRRAV